MADSTLNHSIVRKPCPTEGRLLARQKYKFYNTLFVGGIYNFPKITLAEHVKDVRTYIYALKVCLDQHPFLAISLGQTEKHESAYSQAESIDLSQHVRVVDTVLDILDENLRIQQVMDTLVNDPKLAFFETITVRPGWRLDILPLEERAQHQRAWIAFTYSHCIGDGMSGMIFHRTFLQALNESFSLDTQPTETLYKPRKAELKKLPHLPVGLGFLLGPALGHYLPRFLSRWLGLKASSSGSDEGSWTGPSTFLTSIDAVPPVRTSIEMFTVQQDLLTRALHACRLHHTKLTSLLNVIIAQGMSRHLLSFSELEASKNNFIVTIPTNIRKLAGIPSDTIGNFSSAAYSRHTIDRTIQTNSSFDITESMWATSRQHSAEIAHVTSTITNQPIGLLAWISNLDSWMGEQIGKPRDSSWELSNLMALDGKVGQQGLEALHIEKAYFCQSANAVGMPLDFNTVSVTGGDLVICVGWQVGSIGLDYKKTSTVEETERYFVSRVLADLTRYLEAAVS